MDVFTVIASFVIGGVCFLVGSILGYLFGKNKAYKDTDISQKSVLLNSLTTQVTEMKAKFDAYDELRGQKEKDREKLDEEKEKRYQEFMESTKKFFENQDKIRVDYEEKRDKQMTTMASVIDAFNKTIHGTKTRGLMGEEIVRQYLSESIKSRIIIAPLKTESGEVEYAWNLGDGKHIPIDSKFPDLQGTISSINEETTQSEKNGIRREIIEKTKKEIGRVRKYMNQPNTINKCILAVPESVIELAPEIIEVGAVQSVIICSYKQVFLMGYILSEEYQKIIDEGDLGQLKDIHKTLISILKDIVKMTDTVEKQAKSVIKHNELIRDKVHEGIRL